MSHGAAASPRPRLRTVQRANALDDLVNAIENVLTSRPKLEELRSLSLRLVLRKLAARALVFAGSNAPAGARLFLVSEAESALDADATVDGAFELALRAELAELEASPERFPELLGAVFEGLLGLELEGKTGARRFRSTRRRKGTGSFFTPSTLAGHVVERALSELPEAALEREVRICDPACGAGAFLLAVARALVARRRAACESRSGTWDEAAERGRIVASLAGVDLDPIAVAVAELALWSFAGDPTLAVERAGRLHVGDAVLGVGLDGRGPAFGRSGLNWAEAFPDVPGFDLVIGNPPWIAYAGRATQPLDPERRAFLARRYGAFRGYPTLHAVFVERALELARQGVVALVVPSPIADLDGYRPLRRVLQRTHEPCEPMLEFGQDAFFEVTQPCFALVARPRGAEASPDEAARPFRLAERARHGSAARAVEVPRALLRLREGERMPAELFGEWGFQSTRSVREALFEHLDGPNAEHTYPLLEGRDVREFQVGMPRLFLRPDLEALRKARCRLRPLEEYARVRLVVRQTAKVPIAALHTGVPFRNSLLAGFATEELPAELVVGLLNSSVYRAFHLTLQRDARQVVFPQVKVSHLRALPRPAASPPQHSAEICELVRRITAAPDERELRRDLDELVFSWFGFSASDRDETRALLAERAPELAR